MQDKFEKIDDYLTGEMNDQEKASFENDLANDSAMQQELNMRKDVHRLMASSPRVAFKDNLANVNAGYAVKQTKAAKGKWNMLLFALIGVAIVGIVTMTIINLPSAPEEAVTPAASPELPSDNSNEIKQEPPAEPAPQKEPALSPQSAPKPAQNQAPPKRFYAANDDLEAAINSNLRGTYNWKVKTPQPDADLTALTSRGTLAFNLMGMLETDNIAGDDFELIMEIYSNEKDDRGKNQRVFIHPLDLTGDESPYMFDFSENIPVEARLYYYLIKDTFTGAVLYGGKFRITN